MSDPASVAREYLESFNTRDWARMRALLAPGSTYMGADGKVMTGDQGVAVGEMFAAAMSDGKITIKNIMTSGNTAITEFVASGTHDGELMGVPATGRRLTVPVCNLIDVKDGKIVSEREYMDSGHLMQQLGVIPETANA